MPRQSTKKREERRDTDPHRRAYNCELVLRIKGLAPTAVTQEEVDAWL